MGQHPRFIATYFAIFVSFMFCLFRRLYDAFLTKTVIFFSFSSVLALDFRRVGKMTSLFVLVYGSLVDLSLSHVLLHCSHLL